MQDITTIAILLVSVLPFLVLFSYLDYRFTSKKLRDLNDKISQNPAFLKEQNNMDLCKTISSQTYIWGIYTLIEMRKLNKHLDP